MKIYVVKENQQGYDYEHYNHWVESIINNYYTTEQLAKDSIERLIRDLKPEHNMAWDGKLGDGRNTILIETGYSDNWKTVTVNKYFIETINVIDKL